MEPEARLTDCIGTGDPATPVGTCPSCSRGLKAFGVRVEPGQPVPAHSPSPADTIRRALRTS